jgi:demethylmenaquinone methyltransferase/2-methoxy-6-polyprenyl-1,4-benzoquinol methylase
VVEQVPFGFRRVDPGEKKRLVAAQFDPIARTYDLADAVLSAGLDASWRRRAIRLLGLQSGDRVLDACGGTGDLAFLALRAAGPDGLVVVCDFNRPMMDVGRERAARRGSAGRLRFVRGDAESLGFSDGSFDAVTVGFGLRNLVRPETGLAEMRRVLRPGGKLMILEFSVPTAAWARRLYGFYSFRLMPLLARLITGSAGPFRYLAESIRVFPPPEEIAAAAARAGFTEVKFRRLTGGIAVVYLARASQSPSAEETNP